MIENLKKIEKLINSELTSKVQKSIIENEELLIEINDAHLVEVVQFLKSNEKCKFRQLIDIAGVDYPNESKRFNLVYFLLSHEYNLRIKIKVKIDGASINRFSINVFHSLANAPNTITTNNTDDILLESGLKASNRGEYLLFK